MIASKQCRITSRVPDACGVAHQVVEPSLLSCFWRDHESSRASSALRRKGCFWRDRKGSRAGSALRSASPSFVLLFCLALLAGCATTPTRPATPAASAEVLDSQRGQVLEWTVAGRIAVSNGRDGGSGRIDWQQDSGSYVISLSAPVTRQGWRLSGDATHARLDGIKGGPREGADAESLLREATGWEIPVGALGHWIRGIGAAEHEFGPVNVSYGPDNLPLRLQQAGWSVEYAGWVPVPNGPALPTRLVATQGQAKVRLVMDAWTLPAATEAP